MAQNSEEQLVLELVRESSKHSLDNQAVERLRIIQGALPHLNDLQDDSLKLQVHWILATALWTLNLKDEGIYHDSMCVELGKTAYRTDRFQEYLHVQRYASRLKAVGRLKQALSWYEHGRRLAIQLDGGPWKAGSLNNLGLFYLSQGQLSMAVQYFDSSLAMLDLTEELDSMLLTSILDNQVDVAYLQKDLELASKVQNENLAILNKMDQQNTRVLEKIMNYRIQQAEIHYELGEMDLARTILDSCRFLFNAHSAVLDRGLLTIMTEIYLRWARSDQDPEMQAYYAIQLAEIQDSTLKVRNENQATLTSALTQLSISSMEREMRTEISLSRAQTQLAEDKVRNQTIFSWLVVLLFAAVITIGYIILRSRIKRKHLEKELVEFELEHKRKDVQKLALDLGRKKERAELVLAAAEKISKVGDEQVETLVNDLKEQVKAEHRVDEQREWVHREIETVNSAFYEKLKKTFPLLVETELELCGLIRSGLSNREVAELRGISQSSARMARYRLKKKLKLSAEQDLQEELNKF